MAERLTRPGLPHPASCPLEETMTHILTRFPFVRTILYDVLSWIRYIATPPIAKSDFTDWGVVMPTTLRSTHRLLRKDTSSVIMLTV